MIVATAQPYFAPYPGFLYKAHLADVLVILDMVQFPQGTTWISRNRFKNDQGTLWLTVPVWKKGLGHQPINKVRICYDFKWLKKHLKSLKTAYANAPYLDDHFPFYKGIYQSHPELLLDLNVSLLRYLLKQYGIKTKLILQSELGSFARGTPLLISICRQLEATSYMAQNSAEKYLEKNMFQHAGIELRSFRQPVCIYPQLWGSFIGNLSSFDLLFNCGPASRDILLRNAS